MRRGPTVAALAMLVMGAAAVANVIVHEEDDGGEMVEMIFNDDTQGNETPDEALRELLQQMQQPMLRSRKQGNSSAENPVVSLVQRKADQQAEKKAEPF